MPALQEFSPAELAKLRNELLEGDLDFWQAAEMIQLLLAAHGYGTRRERVSAAISRFGSSDCSLETMHSELQHLALVM